MTAPKPVRLLIVEDEMITARDLQDSLEELGYDVPEIASSGSEALDLAAALHPDLVLMDINLGGASRDGVEVAAELRDRFGLPVIYLTAYADQATLARASVTAPLGYLTKPFERRELHATIQMALVKRQLDEQLRQSESWYSTSLSSIGDGVIATDAAGRVKFINPVAEALTGWGLADAIGKPLGEVFPLSDRKTHAQRPDLATRVLTGHQTIFLEEDTLLCSRAGSLVPVDDSAAPIRDARDGSLLGVVVVFRDLSEKQEMAAELERARRLESLGTLAGGLAHDLNNILAIIAGNVSMATTADAAPETQLRAFAKIDAAVRRAKALTGQFLTFSKGGEPVRRSMELRALLIEEFDLMFGDGAGADEHTERRLEIAPDLWTLEADEGQLRRVVENLLRNAVQSLSCGWGRVTLRAFNGCGDDWPCALVGGHDESSGAPTHWIQLEVSDNGCGIPSDDLARVCDPYFTTRTTGSGLGLSVCHSIARKHNGCLRIHSNVGEGTTVVVCLPALPPAAARPATAAGTGGHGQPPASPSDTSRSLRVLVMDDEPLMRELLARMLNYLGHRATTAETGEEALRLHEEARTAGDAFDAVCIDLVNKIGMGGQEMMARLQSSDPGVVALVCSGYCDHQIMANYRSYGFAGCLPKPINLEQLSHGLRQATAGRT